MKKVTVPLLVLVLLSIFVLSCNRKVESNFSETADSLEIDTTNIDSTLADSTAETTNDNQDQSVDTDGNIIDAEGFVIDRSPKKIATPVQNNTSNPNYYYYSSPTQDPAPEQKKLPRICNICNGVGDCKICNGAGSYDNPYTGDRIFCSACSGTGKCWHCGGSGYEPEY